jgi:Spy/CpxP family protein refolding chaperone
LAIANSKLHAIAKPRKFQLAAATESVRERSRIVFAKEGVKPMKAIIAFVFTVTFMIATAVAQEPGRPPHPPNMPGGADNIPHPPHPPNPDPLAHLMFPPDMIMAHARQLNLTDEQRTFMRSEIQKTTASFQDLQWKLQDQMELLQETMKSTSLNEQQVLAQIVKVLDIEREIKRLHIGLAVRLKNRLTPEQQEQLHQIRVQPR